MIESIIIVGCGGFGREVWSIIQAMNEVGKGWTVEGFVDDSPTAEALDLVAELGSTVIGTVNDLESRPDGFNACIAIASPAVRMNIHKRLRGASVVYPPLVHPDTTIGQGVRFAEGVVVAPGARLSTNIAIGAHVQIDQNATIGHDVTIDEFSRLNPQACVSGFVHVGSATVIGANATILQGLSIGTNAVVGAASCVTRNVSASAIVKGVPARRSA